jgi:hypothetical protein
MIPRAFISLLLASAGLLLAASNGAGAQAAGRTAKAECERLIDVLEQKSPTGAYGSLEKMRVYRQGNHYQACISVGTEAQKPHAARSAHRQP